MRGYGGLSENTDGVRAALLFRSVSLAVSPPAAGEDERGRAIFPSVPLAAAPPAAGGNESGRAIPFSHEHLGYYLDEFTFRFNRRSSASRGKLFYRLVQQAVQTDPQPYRQLVDHNLWGLVE